MDELETCVHDITLIKIPMSEKDWIVYRKQFCPQCGDGPTKTLRYVERACEEAYEKNR